MTENRNLVLRPNDAVGHVATAKQLFAGLAKSLEESLPRGISKELLINAALNSIRKNPKLLECTQASMVSSLMFCAQTGLMPDTALQECHLVPFRNRGVLEVQWIGGFRGLQRLARQSEDVAFIHARVVYANDGFEYNLGTNARIVHVPYTDGEPGAVIFFYAEIKWAKPDYPPLFEVMSKRQVDAVRAVSKAKDLDAWTKHYDEMGRKTVVRRLVKYVPMTRELAIAAELDGAAAGGEDQPLHDTVAEVVDQQQVAAPDSATDKLEELTGAKPEPVHRSVGELMTLLEENKEVLGSEFVERYPMTRLEQMSPEGLDVTFAEIEEEKEKKLAERGSGVSKATKGNKKGEGGQEESSGPPIQGKGSAK